MGAGAWRPLVCAAGFAAAAPAPALAQPTPAFSIVGDTLPPPLTDTPGDAIRDRASLAGVGG